jgi:hypothetical protein
MSNGNNSRELDALIDERRRDILKLPLAGMIGSTALTNIGATSVQAATGTAVQSLTMDASIVQSFEQENVGDQSPASPWYMYIDEFSGGGVHEVRDDQASDGTQSFFTGDAPLSNASAFAIDLNLDDFDSVEFDVYATSNNPSNGNIKVSLDRAGYDPGPDEGENISDFDGAQQRRTGDSAGGGENQWIRDLEIDLSNRSGQHSVVFWVDGDNDAYWDYIRFFPSSPVVFQSTFEDITVGERPVKWEYDPRSVNSWDIFEVRSGGANGTEKKLRVKRDRGVCDFNKEFECSSLIRSSVIDAEVQRIEWYWKKKHKWDPESNFSNDPRGPTFWTETEDGSRFLAMQLGAGNDQTKAPLGLNVVSGDGSQLFTDLYNVDEFVKFEVELDTDSEEFTVVVGGQNLGTFPFQESGEEIHRFIFKAGGFNPSGDSEIDEFRAISNKSERKVDISIKDIRPVQVVFNPGSDSSPDIVLGKEMAVLVYLDGDVPQNFSKNVVISAILNESRESVSKIISPAIFKQTVENDDFVVLKLNPSSMDDSRVICTAQLEETSVSDVKDEREQQINMRSVREVKLAYYKFKSGDKYSSPTEEKYKKHINKSNEFILGTFPLSDEQFSGNDFGEFKGEKLLGGLTGVIEDFVNLEFAAFMDSDRGRAVGVTTKQYFDALGNNGAGLMLRYGGFDSVIVAAGYWVATAHEVAHTFGLHKYKEEYRLRPDNISSDTGSGYWVSKDELIQDRWAFMDNPCSTGVECFKETLDDFWISNDDTTYSGDKKDYDELLQELDTTTRTPTGTYSSNTERTDNNQTSTNSDKDYIYVKGVINKNGTVDEFRWYAVNNHQPKAFNRQDYIFKFIDKNNRILFKEEFTVPFEIDFFDGQEPVQTTSGPFSFSMEYPRSTLSVELYKNEEMLKRFQPLSKLLHDGIDSIPPRGFKDGDRLADKRRKALHNKANVVDKLIESKKYVQASNKLGNDLVRTIEQWIVDAYTKESPSELTKGEVIELINRLINRLQTISNEDDENN